MLFGVVEAVSRSRTEEVEAFRLELDLTSLPDKGCRVLG